VAARYHAGRDERRAQCGRREDLRGRRRECGLGQCAGFYVVITDSSSEDAYPIAATSFALMFASPRVASRTKAAVAFFRWSLQHGQDQATALGFVPLPPEVVSRVEAYWLKRFADGQ
jgi:hypothetical protein